MSQLRITGLAACMVLIATLGAGLAGASGTEALPAADWLIATVDQTREVGYNVSVAVDAETGHTYVSYYEGNNGDLWLARTGAPVGNCGPGDTWECQVLDSTGVVGKYSSIAVGGPGPFAKLYISYHDVTNGSLKIVAGDVERSTGALTYGIQVLESGSPAAGYFAGTATAAAIADSGSVHVAYQVRTLVGSSEVVKYAKKHIPSFGNCGPGDGWLCSTIQLDTDIGDYIDIDVYPGGDPVIAFYDASGSQAWPVVAWRVDSGGTCSETDLWNCSAIPRQFDDRGEYVSLAFDADGHVILAYRNESTQMLEIAGLVGAFNGNCGLWDSYQCDWIDPIGSGNAPSGISMATDGAGQPIIAYHDLESGFHDLKIGCRYRHVSFDGLRKTPHLRRVPRNMALQTDAPLAVIAVPR